MVEKANQASGLLWVFLYLFSCSLLALRRVDYDVGSVASAGGKRPEMEEGG